MSSWHFIWSLTLPRQLLSKAVFNLNICSIPFSSSTTPHRQPPPSSSVQASSISPMHHHPQPIPVPTAACSAHSRVQCHAVLLSHLKLTSRHAQPLLTVAHRAAIPRATQPHRAEPQRWHAQNHWHHCSPHVVPQFHARQTTSTILIGPRRSNGWESI